MLMRCIYSNLEFIHSDTYSNFLGRAQKKPVTSRQPAKSIYTASL